MKTTIKYLSFFVITFLLSFSCFFSKPVIADSGWDADYGGSSSSSWSSSSSSSSSSSWGGGSSSSSWDSDGFGSGSPEEIIFDIIIFIIIIVVFLVLRLISENFKEEISSSGPINELFSKDDFSSFNTEELQIELFDVYKDIQLAWAENNIKPVRKLLTDELFNNYKMQIDTMVSMNQRNVMKDIVFKRMNVIDVTRNNNIEQVKVVMEVTCKDYVVETIDGIEEVIKGDSYYDMIYDYEMTFVRNIKKKTKKCPNCGNKLDDAMSTQCEYCGGVIIHETDHFVLAKKEMLKQEMK